MAKITKKTEVKFVNAELALLNMQYIQLYYMRKGVMTTTHVHPACKVLELTVHLDNLADGALPAGSLWSSKELCSRMFYSEYERRSLKVRTLELRFNY